MAGTTKGPHNDSAIQQVVCPTLAASTTIPMGAIAMTDASGRAVNFVDSTFQGGDIGCLGVAVSRYSNNTASAGVLARSVNPSRIDNLLFRFRSAGSIYSRCITANGVCVDRDSMIVTTLHAVCTLFTTYGAYPHNMPGSVQLSIWVCYNHG